MTTMTGIGVHDQNLEKQIEKHMGGCMAGFFNIFDRHNLLTTKRLYPKRLPPSLPSSAVDSPPKLAVSFGSPVLSIELEKPKPKPQQQVSPDPYTPTVGPTSPLPVAVAAFEFKEAVKSPWKFSREAPRLSLDSRINNKSNACAAVDENQRRSPSVIARLMGLEPLPCSSSTGAEPEQKVELRRSASESRSRDYRFFDTSSFVSSMAGRNETVGERKSEQSHSNSLVKRNSYNAKVKHQNVRNQRRGLMVERKSYYDTGDFFPPERYQQNQNQAVTIYGEIERRLRTRGIDESSKDLETLKHILEALQLKGLLHSSKPPRLNLVFDHHRFSSDDESPIVLMKPARSSPVRRRGNVSSSELSVSPRRERPARIPVRSSDKAENRRSGSIPVVKRKGGGLSVETQRRGSETTSTRGCISPVHSPKMTTTTRRPDQMLNRSPRNRRSTVGICQGERVYSGPALAEDEASTISESSFSTSSHTDNERWRGEEYRDGRNLLERCDKLLHSIAEMTATSNSAELQQPSPVSVLDSSFYKEDESSPSPVKKRTIDFKDQATMELEDEMWSPPSLSNQLLKPDHDVDSSDNSDFSYVSKVLRASNYVPDDTNLFLLLEKQSSVKHKDNTKASILQRKLIFDIITEILHRNSHLPPWKAISISNSGSEKPSLERIWSELRKIQERGSSDDLFEVIWGVLKKDLAGDSVNGWGDCPVEMSDAVLDIERLIFKDLIGETIRDLAAFAGKSVGAPQQAYRRKLVF